MSYFAIIPARFASTRFPGKPLCKLGNMTMIERVYHQVSKVKSFSSIYVATDDNRIFEEVQRFGGNVLMTSNANRSGTDRCADAINRIPNVKNEDIVVNIQGDEPFINPQQIEELLAIIDKENVQIATLIKQIKEESILNNPNVVKVVKNQDNKALYFSRFPIPYMRNIHFAEHTFFQHIGIYAYRVGVLKILTKLSCSSLEIAESLEQLRWLSAGYDIHVGETQCNSTIGIDTEDDLKYALKYIKDNNL